MKRGILFVVPLALVGCLAGPIPDLWPPKPGEPRFVVDVVYRDWHTVLVIPREDRGAALSESSKADGLTPLPVGYEEWELCERGWYLEGRHGFLGVPGALRALCWPTGSGVGQRYRTTPPWTSYPSGALERWTYVVSEKGLHAMRAYLESERGSALERFPGWYEGVHSYHLLYHCHHFTASALRAAGLPIRPWWAFSGWMVEIQLDRIRSFHEEAGLSPRDG